MVKPDTGMAPLGIAGKAGYSLSCVVAALVMVISGFSYFVVRDVSSIGGSHAIVSGPSIGPQNILVMGLESRRDYNGNVLPADLLAAMHAGSVQGVRNGVGGETTNTLILIHIFAGGKKTVGFSIPRDDWVTFPHTYDGQSQGKVDQAYGDAWAQSMNQTANSSMGNNQRNFQANEAGQAAAVATVEALTGVHIDHFAEVNLAGFYELAKSFGGIMACVKPWEGGRNFHDANSGANLKPGIQHLWAAQALAYVRERDNLPQGDIDRTHRQQAVIDYVMWKLQHQNVLSDLSQLESLLSIAKQYVITDDGWNLLDFASEMRGLTGKNLTFRTAPYITTGGHVDGQDVNLIDPAAIRSAVQRAFYPPSATNQATDGKGTGGKATRNRKAAAVSPSSTTVDVLNGGLTAGLAGRVSRALAAAGYRAGQVGNVASHSTTEVLYGAGSSNAANAAKIASAFGVTAAASSSVTAGHVEIVLGTDATTVPSFAGSSSASSSPPPSAS
ncbi:MAG: LCP family protein, partial [Streptosporangiaceae bacterium]|nr:LCP family protein [Streptosporangiaceae bacterium]